jgi:demethylmenaquinone methyltransferase/2-methoxy-6-polyprenyl-1,4-benzoquinol methylase
MLGVHGDDLDALLAEQMAYYRARAPEYDDWWNRANGFDLGPVFAASWQRNTQQLIDALERFAPQGDVLELAAGTGTFTEVILRHADHVTAVDASPEVLAINAARNGTNRVRQITTDLFSWEPPRRWPVIVFGFWISHVPVARWPGFWSLVDRALAPGGRVWFCDNADDSHVTRHGPPEVQGPIGDAAHPHLGDYKPRVLSDGRTFTIVKRYWTPAALENDLATLGWDARCTTTDWAFLHGTATRRD